MPPKSPGAPALAVSAIAFVLLFVGAGFLGPLLGAVGTIPSPFGGTVEEQQYFTANLLTSQVNGFLMVLSAVALLVFTALAYARLRAAVPEAAAPSIIGVGGTAAGLTLALSASVSWTLGQPPATRLPEVTHTLHFLSFVLGGPVHVAVLGLLVFGLAGSAQLLGRAPGWLCVVGYVLAGICVLSSLALVVTPAALLIPLGRFGSMLWLVAISFLLVPRPAVAPTTR